MSSQVSSARPGSTRAGAGAAAAVSMLERVLYLVGGTAAATAMAVIGLTLLVSVVLRYVSGASLEFATELPSYAFPWLVCGGIVGAAGVGGHMAVDFFVVRLPLRARRAVEVVAWAAIVLGLVWAVMAALRLVASFQGQETPILGWPAVGSYWAFPIALVALAVHAAAKLLATVLGVDTHIDSAQSAAGAAGGVHV